MLSEYQQKQISLFIKWRSLSIKYVNNKPAYDKCRQHARRILDMSGLEYNHFVDSYEDSNISWTYYFWNNGSDGFYQHEGIR